MTARTLAGSVPASTAHVLHVFSLSLTTTQSERVFNHGLPVRSCTSGGWGEVGGHGRVRTQDGVCLCPKDTVPLCNLGAVSGGSSRQQGTNTSQSAPHSCSRLSLCTHGRSLHKHAGGALLTASGVGRSLVGSEHPCACPFDHTPSWEGASARSLRQEPPPPLGAAPARRGSFSVDHECQRVSTEVQLRRGAQERKWPLLSA